MSLPGVSVLARLRRRAIHARTRSSRAYWRRAYLRALARRGRWDERMWNGHPAVSHPKVRAFVRRGVAAGLVCTSTTDGQHAPGSYHYAARAADLGVPDHQVGTRGAHVRLVRFQNAEYARRRTTAIRELFGPSNARCVSRGESVELAEGSALEDLHDNHVHGAF